MAKTKSNDILIVLAEDGNVYKLDKGDWQIESKRVKDAQTLGVIKRLSDYGVLLADMPDDVAIGDGLDCKLVNIGALKKLDR